MVEHDALVLNYSHLRGLPREVEALTMLKKVASLVKPLMRNRGWKVGELGEFWPKQENLLGINYNKGQRILLRLRYPSDNTLFLPLEQVTDTMLHELSHIVVGPHNSAFHALWNQLRDEHEALVLRGYTGEGFLSDGHRLGGGRQLPMHEARRLARIAAEKRHNAVQGGTGGGRKLGGPGARPGDDMRRIIANATERRNTVLQGCGQDRDQGEMEREAEMARRNGFRTKAEEDAANDAAIAQAMWELVQEDEKRRYGDGYIPPTAENPAGNGGWLDRGSAPPPPVPMATRPGPEAVVDLTVSPASSGGGRGWACKICTLVNPATYLCCDACGTEKPLEAGSTRNGLGAEPSKKRKASITALPTRQPNWPEPPPKPKEAKPLMWVCSYCGTNMDSKWWTCSTCGTMKDKS